MHKKSLGSLGDYVYLPAKAMIKYKMGTGLLMGFDLLLMEVGVRSMLDGLNR